MKRQVLFSEIWQMVEISCFDVSRKCGHSISNIGVRARSLRGIAWTLDIPMSTVNKSLRNVRRCYPCKMTHVQELFPADLLMRHTFALEFLTHTKVVSEWLWDILWTDEAHFYLHGLVNSQNCSIWATQNTFANVPVPFHSAKVRDDSINDYRVIFFEEMDPEGPVTCAVNCQKYESLLCN